MNLFKNIPKEIWAIGIVTLLMNMSGVIIFFLSPFYLRSLGIDYDKLGMIEGIIECTSWIMRFLSGFLTDFFQKRKPALYIAYIISAIARPFLMFLPSATILMYSRIIDRIGNGIQASPREALIGDLSPQKLKGACFGLRQSLGVIGSFLGASIVWLIMKKTNGNYQLAFTISSIPPILAIIVLYFFVSDKTPKTINKNINIKNLFKELKKDIFLLKKTYWIVVLISSIFMMSNFSGMFLTFKATDTGLSEADAAIVMIIQNIMTILSSYPMGYWSDTIDRRIPLSIGISLVIISNIILATSITSTEVLLGVAIWGFQMGITSSLIATKITDTTSPKIRGTGFGLYYIIVGFALFITNTLSGWIAKNISIEMVFWVSAIYASIALILLPLIKK